MAEATYQAIMTAMKRDLLTLVAVSVVIASSMARRNVMIMTRTFTSHSSQVRSLNVVAIATTFQNRAWENSACQDPHLRKAQMWVTKDCCSALAAGQFRDHREQRHVQRNYDAADSDAEETDHDRFQQGQHVFRRCIDFVLVEVGDLLQHCIHRAGSFADTDHLRHHVWEHATLFQRVDDSAAFFDGLSHLHQGLFDNRVARCSSGNRESFEDRNTRSNQGTESTRKACDGDLSEKNAEYRHLQHDAVDGEFALRAFANLLDG